MPLMSQDANSVLPRRGYEPIDRDELSPTLAMPPARLRLSHAHLAARERFFYRLQQCKTAPAKPRVSRSVAAGGEAQATDTA